MEATDEFWGYSRLLRDAVKKDKMGLEIDLCLSPQIFKGEFKIKLEKIKEGKQSLNYREIFDKIWQSKEYYFNYPMLPKKENFRKYLIDFYSYGLNCHAFETVVGDPDLLRDFEGIAKDDVKTGHDLEGLGLEYIIRGGKNKSKKVVSAQKLPTERLGKLLNWNYRLNIISSLVKLLIFYNTPNKKYNILLIDDNPAKN